MPSLDNLLNPEVGLNGDNRLLSPTASAEPSTSASPNTSHLPPPLSPFTPAVAVAVAAAAAANPLPLGGQYAHHTSALGEHEPHDNCPDALNCLPDTDGRPQHTLPIILRCAILGSPRKRLTIREIYAVMEEKYSYYRTAGQTWKQSVRHHLSLNRLFERQARPVTDPGFGSYWTVNLEAPPGTKRPRKRGRSTREPLPEGANPRKRGRPRKAQPNSNSAQSNEKGEDDELDDMDSEPPTDDIQRMSMSNGVALGLNPDYRPDGVPRLRAVHAGDYGSDEEGGLLTHNGHQGPPGPHPFSVSPNGAGLNPNFPENINILDRLKIEMDNMRRREASAMAERQRMSDSLAEAQAETSRARAAQKAAEKMLREEETLRRDEERLRRDAEGQLREMQVRLSDTFRGADGSPH